MNPQPKAQNVLISHNRLQADCYQWHRKAYPDDKHLLHANVNNSVGGIRGAQNTAIGVKKGRADMEYFKGRELFLFEFKVGRDKQRPEQKEFQQANEREGARYIVITSLEQYKLNVTLIRGVNVPYQTK